MKYKYLLLFIILLLVPTVLAIDDPKPAFDLFYLFVENVFGGVFIAGVGFVILFIFIGMISRMSISLLIAIIGLFIVTYSIGAVGGLAVLVVGIITILYFMYGVSRLVMSRLEG